MGEKGVGKLSQETPPPREGEPMGVDSVVNVVVCWLLYRPSNMLVCLRVGSAQTVVSAAIQTTAADQTGSFTHSKHIDTLPTSPSTDPVTSGALIGNR